MCNAIARSGRSKSPKIIDFCNNRNLYLPVSNQQQPWSYLAAFRRCGRLNSKPKSQLFPTALPFKALDLGDVCEFLDEAYLAKTRVLGYL